MSLWKARLTRIAPKDIISYTVTSTNPFRVKEAVKGNGSYRLDPPPPPPLPLAVVFFCISHETARTGKLCGAFLVDSAFESWMTMKSGLKFDKCEASGFRVFVNDEWEYTMKRSFAGDETQDTFSIRPPARVFSVTKRFKGSNDSFPLPK